MKTLLTFFLAMITTVIFAQTELPSSISNAIKNGNAAELTKSFNINVDLTLLDKQDIYSKTQAESLLKDFFTKNIPSNFTVIHRGGKEDAQYYVGKLTTSTGNYRISILIKGQAKTSFIHHINAISTRAM